LNLIQVKDGGCKVLLVLLTVIVVDGFHNRQILWRGEEAAKAKILNKFSMRLHPSLPSDEA